MINVEKRMKIDAAVRACIGTPWVHQARLPGRALDCIGLAIQAAKASGDWSPQLEAQIPNYGTIPHRNMFYRFMADNLIQISAEEKEIGDLALMTYKSFPMHVGVLSKMPNGTWSMLHAMAELAFCCEEPITTRLKIHSWWRFPSLVREEAE